MGAEAGTIQAGGTIWDLGLQDPNKDLGCWPLQCRFHREVCGGKDKFRSPPSCGAPKPDAKGLRRSHGACKEVRGSWLPVQGGRLQSTTPEGLPERNTFPT